MQLAYTSETERDIDRIHRKLSKLYARLREDGEKPKWMRWRTYERLCHEYEAAEGALGAAVFAQFAAACRRVKRR
jgi:hypothetical protein